MVFSWNTCTIPFKLAILNTGESILFCRECSFPFANTIVFREDGGRIIFADEGISYLDEFVTKTCFIDSASVIRKQRFPEK